MPAVPKPIKQFKKKKRRVLTARQNMIKKLDALTREIVLKRDKECITCGSKKSLQCGHLFTRSKYSTRWDTLNCNAQCPGCNLRHEFDPHIYVHKFIEKFGLEAYSALYRRAETPRKWSIVDLKELESALTKELDAVS